jgi:hypothetical protein
VKPISETMQSESETAKTAVPPAVVDFLDPEAHCPLGMGCPFMVSGLENDKPISLITINGKQAGPVSPAAENESRSTASEIRREDSRGLVLKHAANELVFAVVGHVGCDTSEIAESLRDSLEEETLPGGAFKVQILKAREVINDWAREDGETLPDESKKSLGTTIQFQDLGDKMRSRPTADGESDCPAVARRLILKIREWRAASLGKKVESPDPVLPDGTRRAYILDSLPAEVHLLRHVYQDAFVLIGVVCEENKRLDRLRKKYPDAGETRLRQFMNRDAEAQEKHGQHVADTFHLSDFFVDNTTDRLLEHKQANPDWEQTRSSAGLSRS